MSKTYRVKDWDKIYETAETRKLLTLRWLPVPNKHDGLGYRRIVAQKDAAELFTAWILILQVASKGRGPDERGNLLRGQEALGDEDLAMMTGFPKAIFTRALDFFSNPKQGWLLVHEDELPLSAGAPAGSPASPASSPAVWNGMEENGREGKDSGAGAPALPFESPEFRETWQAFVKHRSEIRKPLRPTSTALQLEALKAMGEERAIAAIRHTIAKGWQGIREPDGAPGEKTTPRMSWA